MKLFNALKITSILFNLYLIFVWDNLFLDIVGIGCLCFLAYLEGQKKIIKEKVEIIDQYEILYESQKTIIEFLDKEGLYKSALMEIQMEKDIESILK